MKRAILFAACLSLLASAALAQRQPSGVPGGNVVNVSGAVKGKVGNRMFTLASGRGTYTVDASKATVRFHGKFFAITNLTPGSFVVARGPVNGTTIMATTVEVTRLAGLKIPMGHTNTTPPKRGGTKGGSKKGTTGGGTGKSG